MACSKKFIFILFFAFFILFAFTTTVRAEWTDDQVSEILSSVGAILERVRTSIDYLNTISSDTTIININVADCEELLNRANTVLNNIKSDTSNINNNLNELLGVVNTLNNNIATINSKLDENHKELMQELEKNNNEVISKLEELKNVLNGDTSEEKGVRLNSFSYARSVPPISDVYESRTLKIESGSSLAYTTFNYTFKQNYTYTFVFNPTTTTSSSSSIFYTFDDVAVGKTIYANYLGVFNNQSTSFSVKFKNNLNCTFIFNNPIAFSNSIGSWTITAELTGSINNVNNSIDQGNKLQQEQNNFLKNDNINTDISSLPQDNTQDITSDGFNNIFTQIYNTFTSGSAKDLVIAIPFTQKSFVINVANVYAGADLGFVKTLIQVFWYFAISYYIVKDVGRKINKIKSGDIENVETSNVKEDML